jgi:hypothetical protein
MTLEELYAKKQEIKERRSVVLQTLRSANAELREIDVEFIAVDLEIKLEEEKEYGIA